MLGTGLCEGLEEGASISLTSSCMTISIPTCCDTAADIASALLLKKLMTSDGSRKLSGSSGVGSCVISTINMMDSKLTLATPCPGHPEQSTEIPTILTSPGKSKLL
jgi:hypothetical protein